MWKRPSKAKNPDSAEEAFSYALFLLRFRFRGFAELKSRLIEKGFDPKAVERAMEKLADFEYLNDERLIENMLRQYRERGTYGRRYIYAKLLQKQFSKEQIQTALDKYFSKSDEVEAARRLLFKDKNYKYLKGANIDDEEKQKARQKLLAKMQRRGFGGDAVFKLLR